MRLWICLFILLIPIVAFSAEPQKQYLNPDTLFKSPSYTHVVSVTGGRLLFISGQVSMNAKGDVVGKGDLKAQTIQVHENLKAALAAAGADFTAVVKINTYIVGYKPEMLSILREVRGKYFPEQNRPASTLIGVQALANEDYLIEIEAIAAIP